jgi:hypothetical protein
MGVHTDEFEVFASHQGPERVPAHTPDRPLDDAIDPSISCSHRGISPDQRMTTLLVGSIVPELTT